MVQTQALCTEAPLAGHGIAETVKGVTTCLEFFHQPVLSVMESGSIGQLLDNVGSISDKISFMASRCLQCAGRVSTDQVE